MAYHVIAPTSRPDRAKISHFQNLFRFIQYGCRSFSIDASSDPTKFQDDWPSGRRLIGAWSSDFAFNVFVCQVEQVSSKLVQIHSIWVSFVQY